MVEDGAVRATSVFEGIGKDRQMVEGPIGMRQSSDSCGTPSSVENGEPKRSALRITVFTEKRFNRLRPGQVQGNSGNPTELSG